MTQKHLFLSLYIEIKPFLRYSSFSIFQGWTASQNFNLYVRWKRCFPPRFNFLMCRFTWYLTSGETLLILFRGTSKIWAFPYREMWLRELYKHQVCYLSVCGGRRIWYIWKYRNADMKIEFQKIKVKMCTTCWNSISESGVFFCHAKWNVWLLLITLF